MAVAAFTIEGVLALIAGALGLRILSAARMESPAEAPLRARLVWFDRTGHALDAIPAPGGWTDLRLSPDGARVLGVRALPDGTEIWEVSLQTRTCTRITQAPVRASLPVWLDDRQIAYLAWRDRYEVRRKRSGGGPEIAIVLGDDPQFPQDSSPDGRSLLVTKLEEVDRWKLKLLPLGAAGESRPAVLPEPSASDGRFSPDGRWIAYTTARTEREQVAVAPSALVSQKGWPVSITRDGGHSPEWARSGRELFYVTSDGYLTAVEWDGLAGAPRSTRRLFRLPPRDTSGSLCYRFGGYAADANGERFLVALDTN